MLDMILGLLIVVPLILLAVTVVLAVNSYKKLKKYKQCTGVIVKFYEGEPVAPDRFGEIAISPVISYTAGGKNYEFIGNYCSTSMKVGQEIQILYNEENPAKATIKTGLYFGPIVTGALTLFFASALVIFLILKSKGIISF